MKTNKTNAMRMLDSAKIKYEVLEYDLDKDLFSGEAVSDLLGLEYSQCYKTLALRHEHDLFICVISVKDELDLKKCAKALGVKNVEMVHVKDLLKDVGYERNFRRCLRTRFKSGAGCAPKISQGRSKGYRQG